MGAAVACGAAAKAVEVVPAVGDAMAAVVAGSAAASVEAAVASDEEKIAAFASKALPPGSIVRVERVGGTRQISAETSSVGAAMPAPRARSHTVLEVAPDVFDVGRLYVV